MIYSWQVFYVYVTCGGAPNREGVQLVYVGTVSLGLMNGGYIELGIGIINQQTSLGGTTL